MTDKANSISLFDRCLKEVLKSEGGYVNDPRDRGGETNKGVTKAVYDSYRLSKELPIRSVKYITDEEVADIYFNRYWLPSGCAAMPPRLAMVVFDTSVNMGIAKSMGYLQELIGTKQNSWNARLANDLAYYLKTHGEESLLKAFLERRRTSYRRFAEKPSQRVFLQGWLNRVASLETFTKGLV